MKNLLVHNGTLFPGVGKLYLGVVGMLDDEQVTRILERQRVSDILLNGSMAMSAAAQREKDDNA